MKKLTFWLLLLLTGNSFGQKSPQIQAFTNRDFNAYEIDKDTYDLWNRQLYTDEQNPIHYFVDSKDYKGTVNCGVKFATRDKSVYTYIEDYSIWFLDVNIEKCTFNPKDSLAEISGNISGGWTFFDTKDLKDELQIFVGEKKDTLYDVKFVPQIHLPEICIVTYKNEVRERQFTIDTLPACYFRKQTYHEYFGSQKTFTIKCKVNEKSVLAIAKTGCYVKMYDLGSLFFSKKRKSGKDIVKKKDDIRKVAIIEKNVQVKNRPPKEPDPQYYVLTEKAENFILSRQYAKAKETYFQLAGEYERLFARDLHNAIRCSILSRDFKSAQVWGEKLAQKGIDIKYFNAKIFKGWKQSPMWKPFSVRFDSISRQSQLTLDQNLKQQYQTLTDEDQADYGLENRKEAPILYETTQRVTDKLVDLLEKSGFPSEEKIGVFMKNDTVISLSPRFNVMIRHAVQQSPKGLDRLNELLDKSFSNLEYDKIRSDNHTGFPSACLQIYKGNLYNDKSCGNNDLMVQKMVFKFSNPNNFILDYGDFIVTEYNEKSPEDFDKYYEERFDFVVKLTDDWKFYEK